MTCRPRCSARPGAAVIAARNRSGSCSALQASDSEIDIEPRNGLEAEFDAWKWIPAAELVDMIVPFKRDVYRAVVDEFAPLIRPL